MRLKAYGLRYLNIIKERNSLWIGAMLLCLCFSFLGQAQTTHQLKEKRNQLTRKIKHDESKLKEIRRSRTMQMERYEALRDLIESREELVSTIREELTITDESLEKTDIIIESLHGDISRLKTDYAQLVQLAYKRRLLKSDLLFIFSSASFNDAYKRWRYLKQYDKYRRKQAHLIVSTQKSLERKMTLLELRKAEKSELLNTEKSTLKGLNRDLKKQKKLLSSLKKNEKKLKITIKKQEKDRESLISALEKALNKDYLDKRDSSRDLSLAADKPEAPEIKIAFNRKKGKLPWPVNGFITRRFGVMAHPTSPNIKIENHGIDILVSEGSVDVYPVHPGKVVMASFVRNNGYVVLLEHKDGYFTLYSKMKNHYVTEGSWVSTKDIIGHVAKDNRTKRTVFHFEVWKNDKRLDPAKWLQKS